MTTFIPTRQDALAILKEFNKNQALINHAIAVEAVMRYIARKQGEDEEKWGIIGLIHDLDYEMYPEEHCKKIREILVSRAWPEEFIRATESHGWQICTDIRPETALEKTLYAIDELTGLVAACALVRPSKSVMDLEVKSVKKKWKQKNFAAGVNREIIAKGAELCGIELSELISNTIMGMREVADEIGL